MILDTILEILKRKSNNKAYTINNKSYTYSELYIFVCNIYNFLLSTNLKNKVVIVYGNKDIYMKATFLACSFSGITYIPIDKSIPYERIKEIITQVNPGLIIGNLNLDLDNIVNEEKIYEIMNNNTYLDIDNIYMEPDDIYYIIFTSGSTGKPKGVKVTYKNLNSCVNWLKNITKINREVILNQANFSFDLSVADLYLSITTESEHFILDDDIKKDFPLLFKQLKNSKSTLAVFTPSFAELLLLDRTFGEDLMPELKTIIFCGEKLLGTTVQKLYSRFKNIRIINTYGPTECTFAVTSIEIEKDQKDNIPIGIPKSDVKIFIIDEDKKELKEGQIGEILITGESVANGYIGNLNKNKFIDYKGKRGYLTGDLGYIENGILYYECRKDKQIKYKGYRIEISDIEKNLYDLKYIEKVIVTTKRTKNGKIIKLIAFVKIKNNVRKNENDIKKDLKKKLPEYMCPNIKIINEIPLNKNGKCDEKKLMEDLKNGR